MCGPHFCSMKITEDVRKHAAEKGLSEEEASRPAWTRNPPSSLRAAPKFTPRREERSRRFPIFAIGIETGPGSAYPHDSHTIFWKEFFRLPHVTGAIAPSSKHLAKVMVEQADVRNADRRHRTRTRHGRLHGDDPQDTKTRRAFRGGRVQREFRPGPERAIPRGIVRAGDARANCAITRRTTRSRKRAASSPDCRGRFSITTCRNAFCMRFAKCWERRVSLRLLPTGGRTGCRAGSISASC